MLIFYFMGYVKNIITCMKSGMCEKVELATDEFPKNGVRGGTIS